MSKEDIYKRIRSNIAIDNYKEDEKNKAKVKNRLSSVIALVLCMFSVSSMVFAKDISLKIYENFFDTGNGVGAAIENGYIEERDEDDAKALERAYAKNEYTGKVVDGSEVKVTVDKFLMDDFNLSVTLDVELSNDLDSIINTKNIKDMTMPDLIVYDENDIILSHESNYAIKQFCEFKNLNLNDYDILKGSSKVVNTGINQYIQETDGNHIKLLFNIYTGEDSFPKSKELNFYLTEIRLSENPEAHNGEEEVSLSSMWNFKVDVPEKMYQRTKTKYDLLSCDDDSFKLKSAYLYNTGMNLSFEFQTGEKGSEEKVTVPEIEFWESLENDDYLKDIDILNYYWTTKLENNEEYRKNSANTHQKYIFDKYLTNENGERFELTMGPRENGGSSIDDNGIMHFSGMFDLTKYDAQDRVTLNIDYHGKKIEAVLTKVGEE